MGLGMSQGRGDSRCSLNPEAGERYRFCLLLSIASVGGQLWQVNRAMRRHGLQAFVAARVTLKLESNRGASAPTVLFSFCWPEGS